MRVIAILATYNEERFIVGCLEHLFRQGVEVYLIDNCSTDRTVALAERSLTRGLVGLETLPRDDVYSWRPILKRKEQLAATLDADWFIHLDADEVRLAPWSDLTLAQALEEVTAQGYNAVNFMEFTFVPTTESPDHDHSDFQQTMRWYYPFLPRFPHQVKAWQRQRDQVELCESGGHHVKFPKLRLFPVSFKMRHYLFLSVDHAIQKYVNKNYDPLEVSDGWHGWRARLQAAELRLPTERDLRFYTTDEDLDSSTPRTRHFLDDLKLLT